MPPQRNQSPLLRSVMAPVEAFFRLEESSGLVLVAAALLALLWANSPWGESLTRIRAVRISLNTRRKKKKARSEKR